MKAGHDHPFREGGGFGGYGWAGYKEREVSKTVMPARSSATLC
jgi:hypothetical protein